jgi:hypothetical protein
MIQPLPSQTVPLPATQPVSTPLAQFGAAKQDSWVIENIKNGFLLEVTAVALGLTAAYLRARRSLRQ